MTPQEIANTPGLSFGGFGIGANNAPAWSIPNAENTYEKIVQQILSQGTTNKWSGEGFGSAEANARDMAKILANIGITDIRQFGELKQTVPADVQYTVPGIGAVEKRGDNYYAKQVIESGDGFFSSTEVPLSASQAKNVQATYGRYVDGVVGEGENQQYVRRFEPVDPSKIVDKGGVPSIETGGVTYGNKLTGQVVPSTYGKRQTGNAWGGTTSGDGNTGYRVDFAPDGTPVFYTTGSSSSDLGNVMPIISLGLGLAFPGVGAAIGSALGAGTGAIATALGNAVIGGTLAEAQGGDFLQGALAAGAGSAIGAAVAPIAASVSDAVGSQALGQALTSGTLSELQGGDFLQGAIQGGISGAINDAKLDLANQYIDSVEPGIGYDDLTSPTELDVLDAYPELASQPVFDAPFVPESFGPSNLFAFGDLGTPTLQELLDSIQLPEPVFNDVPEASFVGPTLDDSSFQNVVNESTIDEILSSQPVVDDIPEIVITAPRPSESDLTQSNVDYSLFSNAPVISDMGAQGLQVPTINEIVDVVNQPVDYSLSVPDSGLGLVMPTAPNLDSMGGGQGLVVPVDGGVITESGFVPDGYVPNLGDPNTFINQPAPTVEVSTEIPAEKPKDISSDLALLDAIKAISPLVLGAALNNNTNQPSSEQQSGYPILPIPSEWKPPEYGTAFTPSAPIDFGSRDLLKGTQWDRPAVQPRQMDYNLSDVINTLNFQSVPFVQQQMPQSFTGLANQPTSGVNNIIGDLNGKPVSLSDIISGIQSQYGQKAAS